MIGTVEPSSVGALLVPSVGDTFYLIKLSVCGLFLVAREEATLFEAIQRMIRGGDYNANRT